MDEGLLNPVGVLLLDRRPNLDWFEETAKLPPVHAPKDDFGWESLEEARIRMGY